MTAALASRPHPPIVAAVVQQHAEEAAMLSHLRQVLVRAPHVRLLQLGRLDERIAAHLDGLAVAGPAGHGLLRAALERPRAGEVFAAAVAALHSRDSTWFDDLVALAGALPEARQGLLRALGWVSAADLQGVGRTLLGAADPVRRELGLAACRLHRVDPGPALAAGLADAAVPVRVAALRAAAELGRTDLLEPVRGQIGDDHPGIVFWAAWAAALLGDRHAALRVLAVAAQQDTPQADAALSLVMAASEPEAADDLARQLSQVAQADPTHRGRRRRLIRALGLLGDVRFVPWLVDRMAEPLWARLAGESFMWITGTDLARDDLETLQPPPLPEQPSADPADDDVSLDEDADLPWPDPAKVAAWWQRQAALQARGGERLFMGAAPGAALAQQVLREGTQRQRAHAARLACLIEPGRVLFPVAAPVPRQRRLLAAG